MRTGLEVSGREGSRMALVDFVLGDPCYDTRALHVGVIGHWSI